jgi:hypothetical protein
MVMVSTLRVQFINNAPPNQRMKPTLLSSSGEGVFGFEAFQVQLVTLCKPQGGLCACRYAG